jgi:hypothetical protein
VVLILLAMLLIVVTAGLVVLYVAYPHRGEEVPNVPWIGDALRRGVARLPTLDNQGEAEHPVPSRSRSARQPERQLH